MGRVLFLLLIGIITQLNAGIGKVAAVRGEASFFRADKTIPVKLGADIERGDTLITRADAKLQLILKDRTIITIGQNSHFSINDYLYETATNSKAEFFLGKGIFKSVTGGLGKLAPQRFKIKTKTATMGIRGTTFVVEVTDEKTLLSTILGETYYIDLETQRTFNVPQNRQLIYEVKTKEINIVPLPQKIIEIGDTPALKQKVAKAAKAALGSLQEGVTTESVIENISDFTQTTLTVDNIVDEDLIEVVPQYIEFATQQSVGIDTYFSFGYWLDSDGVPHTPWADGSLTDLSAMADYQLYQATAYYSGTLVAVVDGQTTEGSFGMNADFGYNMINGSINFTDQSGRQWLANFSDSNAISGNSFVTTNVTQGDTALTILGGSVDGSFYGPASTSPIPGVNGVAGTFTINADDAGLGVTAQGSFGATSIAY